MEYRFEGSISVKAVMLAGKRQVTRIVLDQQKKDRDSAFILAQANKRGIPVELLDREQIDRQAEGNSHGGVLCYAQERCYETVDAMRHKTFLGLLEGIEDPFNFGYCLRSFLAAGCEGVLVNQRNWYESAGVIAKSSAGASEYLAVCPISDWREALQSLKPEYRVIAAQRKDATNLYEADLTMPMILAIGGERRGLSKAVNDMADQNIYIPYQSDFRNALNACSAVSVIAFERLRQLR